MGDTLPRVPPESAAPVAPHRFSSCSLLASGLSHQGLCVPSGRSSLDIEGVSHSSISAGFPAVGKNAHAKVRHAWLAIDKIKHGSTYRLGPKIEGEPFHRSAPFSQAR
jgi:hypothetical protein